MKANITLDESVSSPQDLKALILEIRDYARWFSHNAIKRRLHARNKHHIEEPVFSPAATAVLHEWGALTKQPLGIKSLDELIATLEDYAETAPQLTITLAGAPTNGIKKTLVAWCRQNISPTVLVNFQFNSALLGGMVVRYGSRVFDWSFRRQILNNLDKFPETLRNV